MEYKTHILQKPPTWLEWPKAEVILNGLELTYHLPPPNLIMGVEIRPYKVKFISYFIFLIMGI